MSTKFKILSTISFICLALVLTFVGVWALTDLDFVVGGNITYTAPAPEPVTPSEVSYLTFEYDSATLTAKLTACSSSAPETVEIPAQITKDAKTYTVTSIKEGYYDYIDDEGEGMFYNTGVKNLYIPDSVTEIGNYAFYWDSFTSLSIGTSVQQDFGNQNPFLHTSIKNLTIRNGVTRIGSNVFSEADIQNIELPKTLKVIGDGAFWYALYSTLVLPDSVEVIEMAAFNCCGFNSVTIGSGIKEIGGNAFYLNSRLTEVYIKATTPPALAYSGTFGDEFSAPPTIFVPRGSESLYQSAEYWSDYNIQGYDF